MEIIDGIHWDYGPNDPIDYFDPEKSYYLTGYRPINNKDGLEFNPDWFRQAAIRKLSSGVYSGHPIGSPGYLDFWREEKRRCIEGYSSNGYTITGDNYFFLNYYNLKTSDSSTTFQQFGFPLFLVFQYEYFHYVEMAMKLKQDVAVLKARAVGFSEIASGLAANTYTMIPNYRSAVTAYSSKLLSPTLSKIWYQLDWLNENTEYAFRRVRMNVNTKLHKRASKKDKDLREHGHMSEIEGMYVDEPDKLRGDRVQKLIFEEAGADKILLDKWIKGRALITVLGGKIVGTRIAFGTGGSSKASSMEGLQKLITNPLGYNVLPVRHNHTVDGSYKITGLFIPAYRIVFDLLDNRGWCDPEKAKEWFLNERKTLESDPKELLKHTAEYCFTIEEALIQHEDNMFPVEELSQQLTALEIYKEIKKPKNGFLNWETTKDGIRTGRVKWREDPNGNVQIHEHPAKGDEGQPIDNLYVGGIDSIDIGGKDTATQDNNKLSDFCIVIKKRMFGLDDPKYVAIYKDRPRDIHEAYETAAKLLVYYNARAVLESTRTAILGYFRTRKYISLLMKRPKATVPSTSKTNTNMIGAPASTNTIDHYRELVYEFCLNYSHTIVYREMLEQLLNYSDEKKKQFDIVAALGMAELADEELSFKKPKEKEKYNPDKNRDIGYWVDDRGYKRYGIIPKTQEEKNKYERIGKQDSWLYKALV